MIHALVCSLALLAAADEKYLAWTGEAADITALPASRTQRLSAAERAALAAAKPTPPFDDLTVAMRAADGGVWAGSRRGLMYLAPQTPRWRLFHSRRWLPNDEVQDLMITADGEVYVKTPGGFGKLSRRETTLEQKMAALDEALQKHHVRDGFVAHASLQKPGDVTTAVIQPTNDNDGLWTSIYVAAEAFRYGATGDAAAKRNARRSLEALMLLERVSGIPGFVARSVVPTGAGPVRWGGEWHRSADGRWWWKGDTSSDEVVGHYFAYSIYYDVAADEREKEEIVQYVARITDHILDHGLYYVGPSGEPTTWGV